MAKQRAIKLRLDNTYEERNYKVTQNKIHVSRKDKVIFEPICVFTERKPRWRFWRGAKKLILFVDGALNALRFAEVTDEMNPSWTKEETKSFVYKKMSEAMTQLKPMTWLQFVILLIPIGISLFMLFKIGTHLGAF